MHQSRITLGAALLLLVTAAAPSHAQWALNGVLVSSTDGSHRSPIVAPDGTGGAFIVWWSTGPSGPSLREVLVSHVLPDGRVAPGFPAAGLPVVADTTTRNLQGAGSDGDHGVVVGWAEPTRAAATRLLGDGTRAPGWSAIGNEVALRGRPSMGFCADGSGGGWFWSREDISFCPDICYNSSTMYADHVGPSGVVDASPYAFATTPYYGAAQGSIRPAANGSGFMVGLGGDGVADDIHRVIVPNHGQWSLTLDMPHGIIDAAVDDGAGGVLLMTQGSFGLLPERLLHLTASGGQDPAWPAGGVPVWSPDTTFYHFAAIAVDAGSMLVGWIQDGASGAEVRVKKFSSSGNLAPGWPAEGIVVCDAPGPRDELVLAGDGSGGAFVAWRDGRDSSAGDVYAHRVRADASLDPTFGTNGLGVATLHAGVLELSLAATGPGEAVLAWSDQRSLAEIRAQKLPLPGTLSVDPGPRASIALAGFVPNPSRDGCPRIAFTLARSGDVSLDVFDVLGRRVHTERIAGASAGRHTLTLARPLPAGLYEMRLREGAQSSTARGMVRR